jgi:hypothetical protein
MKMADCLVFRTDIPGETLGGLVRGWRRRGLDVLVEVLVTTVNSSADVRLAGIPKVIAHSYDQRWIAMTCVLRRICVFNTSVFLDCKSTHGPGTENVYIIEHRIHQRGGLAIDITATEFLYGKASDAFFISTTMLTFYIQEIPWNLPQ